VIARGVKAGVCLRNRGARKQNVIPNNLPYLFDLPWLATAAIFAATASASPR
jgi:hypothetical protein